jgi:hypothetical protein
LDGGVATSTSLPWSHLRKEIYPRPNILEADRTLVDENSCGQISDGFLTIQGKTKVLGWDPKHHERVLGDVVVKAIMEAVNNYFVDHDAEHIFYDGYRFCQVFIDSLDDPWIEVVYMVPVLTYCN